MEWKKVKFMERRIGEDFDGLIISVTKFGFFVELTDLFVEGLVPLNTLADDRYTYHENTRQIIGQRSRKTYSLGDRVRVLGGPHRSGREEDSVRGVRRAAQAVRKKPAQVIVWGRAPSPVQAERSSATHRAPGDVDFP